MTVIFEGKTYRQEKQDSLQHICKGCAFGHGTDNNFKLDPCAKFGSVCKVNSNLIFKEVNNGKESNRI